MATRIASNPSSSRVILVTGASGGIGQAVIRRLRRDGARIAAFDVLPVRSSRAVLSLHGDATCEADVVDAVARTVDRHGRLDALVHAVGRVGSGGIEACSLEQ